MSANETSHPTRDQVERRLLAIACAIGIAGALVTSGGWHVEPLLQDHSLSIWLLAPAIVLCELAEIRLRLRSGVTYLSLGLLPAVVGLVLVPPGQLAVAMTGVVAAVMGAQRLRPSVVIYNASVYLLVVSAGSWVFRLLAPAGALDARTWLACLVATVVMATLGLASAAVLDAVRGTFRLDGWAHTGPLGLGAELLNATIAYLGMRVIVLDGWNVVPVAVVAAAMVVAYRGYAGLLNHHESLERLYRSTRDVERSAGHRASVQALLDQTLELLGADLAELAFLPTDDQPAMVLVAGRDRLFEEFTGPQAERIAVDRTEDNGGLAVLDLLPEYDSVTAKQLRSQMMTAPLQGPGGVVGSIRVSMNYGGAFSDVDRQLLEMFANHASVALHNSRLIDRLRAEVAEREHQALHDQLTSLPNRVMFDLQVREALQRRGAGDLVAVLLVDLDRFKEVNDTLGHDRGDELLEQLAARLVRLADLRTLTVARLGGDEFAALVCRSSEAEIRDLAVELQSTLEDPIEIAGVVVDVGASIGVAVAPLDGDDATVLLQRADVAMYAAKADHRDVAFYLPEADPYSPQRLAVAADLRRAVAAGDLEVHFQPVTSLVTGEAIAVEALARWRHPELGDVSPDLFIPIAERSGLIRDLTFHVLDESLRVVRQLRVNGFYLRVAVNLSLRVLESDDLPARLARHLELAGVAPETLTLEVTEGTIMSDPHRAVALLHELHDLGVGLSIDDFGMGYSSLNQLKRLPVNQLKVDRSFVTGLPNDRDDAVIVQSVVDLGHNLGMQVVAEGVEDAASLDHLRLLGCDAAQGFYLATPMPREELLAWLHGRSPFARSTLDVLR